MHGEPDALFVCAIHRLFVPRIGVSEDAHHGVVGQHPGQSAISRFRAVGHNHLAGVLAEADAHAATMVERDPRRAGSDVGGKVQQWPVRNGIGAIEHCFGFSVGGSHGAAIKVIATNHDGGGDFAFGHQLIEQSSRLVSLAETEPTNSRRESLEGYPFFGCFQPPAKRLVFGEELEQRLVRDFDVVGIARQGGPAEGPRPSAELRTDVCGDEAWEGKRITTASIKCPLTEVVAVIEDLGARSLHRQHEFHVSSHRMGAEFDVLLRIAVAKFVRIGPAHSLWVVPPKRIVRTGLVGQGLRHDAPRFQSLQQGHRGAAPANADRFTIVLLLRAPGRWRRRGLRRFRRGTGRAHVCPSVLDSNRQSERCRH